MKKGLPLYIFVLLGFMAVPALSVAQKNPNETDETKVLTPKEVETISYYYEGTTQKLLGNNQEALASYLLCVQKDPKNAAAYYQIAVLYNENKQPTEAEQYAKQAVSLDPKNKWYLLEYADVLIKLDKIKQASKVYDQLLKLEPDNTDYQLQKADILIYLKKYKGAIEIYDKLEKKLGMMSEITLQKQKLYVAQGKYDAAEREMQLLIEKFPNEPEYYGLFAEFYLSIRKKDKALEMFKKVLELDPQNPIIHLAIANYYQENKDNEKAYEYIKLAFENPSVEVDNKIQIMLSYYDLSANNTQRKKEAEELLEILLRVNPDSPKAWAIYGDFLLRDEKIKESIGAFEKVLELQSDRYAVWDQLLELYQNEGMYDSLASKSAAAVELFPSMPVFYYYNGYANYFKGDYEKALESYSTGKDLVISDPNQKSLFLLGLAETFWKMKNNSAAESSFESALNVKENFFVLISYGTFLSMEKNDQVKATDMATRAKKIDGNSYEVLYLQALIAFKSDNQTEAASFMKTCLENGGVDYAEVLELNGDILYKSGKISEAVEQWTKAKTAKGKYSEMLDAKIQQQKYLE